MYQLLFDGYPIYDPRDDALTIREPDIHLAVGEAGTLAFLVDYDHPYLEKLTKLRGVGELRADGVPIFKWRIRKETRDFYNTREIEAEGLLACLNDSIIPPYNFPQDWQEDAAYQAAAESGNVVRFFLSWLLEQHNSQVTPAQQIQLGEVTVADPNNYISREASDYSTTMDVVRNKLQDLLGGYLLPDYTGDVPVLNYYAELPLTNTQVVEFGENLLDLESDIDAANTFTAILPVGKSGLTLESLADGTIAPGYIKSGKIIYSEAAEEIYDSRILRKVDWPDVTEPVNLQTKALARLSGEGTLLTQSITVKAVDLWGAMEDGASRFVVGRLVQLNSAPHGYSRTFPLMELEPNILDPGDTNITLGATYLTASGLAQSDKAQAQEKHDQQQIEINQQKQEVTEFKEIMELRLTEVVQTTEAIILEALTQYVETGNFEEFKSTVESQLSVMADEISLRFTETNETIADVNGDLQATREQLSKYFEFTVDGLTIKAGETAMQLKLDNDVISFNKNGQQFGWWDGVNFHTGNIVIDVTERAQFGNFAFVPRTDGSLSLLKVGG